MINKHSLLENDKEVSRLLSLPDPDLNKNIKIESKSRSRSIRLTPRDLNLLRWINSVGFVTINQIAQRLKISHPTAYVRAKKLVFHEYLLHERIFHGAAGIYRVTHEGVQVCGSPMPSLRKVSLGSYHHDLLVTSLSLRLLDKFGGCYVPERELRHGDGLDCFGRKGHTPDSVFLLNDKKIAVEVELSKKSKRRRNEIFNYYLKNFNYQEVWYFCGNKEIEGQLKPFLEKANFVKAYQLQEFLNAKETANEWSSSNK